MYGGFFTLHLPRSLPTSLFPICKKKEKKKEKMCVASFFLLYCSLSLCSVKFLKALNIQTHCISCLFIAVAHELLSVHFFLFFFLFCISFFFVHLLSLVMIFFFVDGPYFTICVTVKAASSRFTIQDKNLFLSAHPPLNMKFCDLSIYFSIQ